MNPVIMILICVGLLSAGELLLKKGMLAINDVSLYSKGIMGLVYSFTYIFSNIYVFSGFFLIGISSLIWLMILSKVELSYAYPMVSMGYVLVAILSWILFKENLSIVRWLGIAMICGGVYLISRS
ncbi:MAG: EamA family transporter [Synergistetes bacterium]|nr:EamA family transporter [Synergistota bacterium]